MHVAVQYYLDIKKQFFYMQTLEKIPVNIFCQFFVLERGQGKVIVCSFELCMWLSRNPRYVGIISGKQTLARMTVNGFADFLF